jgi:hypothetical protein
MDDLQAFRLRAGHAHALQPGEAEARLIRPHGFVFVSRSPRRFVRDMPATQSNFFWGERESVGLGSGVETSVPGGEHNILAGEEFESRTGALAGRGSKRALITSFIDSVMVDEFTIADVRQAVPGVSDGYINRVLSQLKDQGRIKSLGTGRSARWRRLSRD